MCPPNYHHNGFVATHALGHMMYGGHMMNVHELPQSHCGDNWRQIWDKLFKKNLWEKFYTGD